jgi:hypothetical protein
MATRGRPLPRPLIEQAIQMARDHSIRYAAKQLQIDRHTVRKYLRHEGKTVARGCTRLHPPEAMT